MRYSVLWGIVAISCILTINSCNDSESEPDILEQGQSEFDRQIIESLKGEIIYSLGNNLCLLNFEQGEPADTIADDIVGPAKWSPDGSKIAYIREKLSPISGIYLTIIDKNGTQQDEWQLDFSGKYSTVSSITWSPNGKVIAILENNALQYFDVLSREITTTVFFHNSILGGYSSISWQPNSNKIAISSSYISHIGIYSSSRYDNTIRMLEAYRDKIPIDSTNIILSLKDVGGTIRYMDWNKDGSKLIYSHGSNLSIYTVNDDQSIQPELILKNLHKDEKIGWRAPCWSPNDKKIIYSWPNSSYTRKVEYGIYVTDIYGSYNVKVLDYQSLHDWK